MAEITGRVGWRSFLAPTSLSSIVTNGLIFNLDASNAASYPGTGTTWTDVSGGKNGTLMNGAAYSSANGGTIVLDGVNDYVAFNLGSYKTMFGTSTSFSTWVKYTNVSGSGVIFGDWNNLGAYETARLQLSGYRNGAGKIGGYLIDSGGVYGNISSTTTISQDVWYHYSMTYDGTTLKLYVNGILESQVNYSPTPIVGGGNFAIGRSGSYNGGYAPINISSFQVYNRALSSTEVLQNFNGTKARFGYPSYTARTAAFATATGITDATILNALNTFDTGLISNGLDTKMKALYPFVGGTANTHKFNFMDARDVDAAFRLTFSGGWTHSSTGAKPNGTNGYADTFLNNNMMGQNNVSVGVYLGEDNPKGAGTSCVIGSWNSGGTWIYPGANNGYAYLSINSSSSIAPYANGDGKSRGLYLISKTTSDSFYSIRGNLTNATFATNTYVSTPFKLSANGAYAYGDYGAQQQRLAYIGDGLSTSEASTFYTLVQALQTSLSRQV